jgi:histidine phosphotransferase ChpT
MAKQVNALRLAELLASRLCHDLSGPLGGLNQALELAAPNVAPGDEAFAVARQAARELMYRLRFLRAAWGPSGFGLDVGSLRVLTFKPGVTCDVDGLPADVSFAPEMSRVLVNVLLVAHESMPQGGRIALSGASDDVYIAIEGPGAAWPVGFGLYLADADAAAAAICDARAMQAPLTALLAHGLGVRLSMLLGRGSGAPPLRLSER